MAAIARVERFGSVDSTQRIVREWLEAGDPGICVAVADEQTAGRGRGERSWIAPPGAALLTSAGIRPAQLSLRHAWRLAAVASVAMIDAAEAVARLPAGKLWSKWPNDIVADGQRGRLLKVAGVLGETVVEDGLVAAAIIGVGVNVDWPATSFPDDLAAGMTSLRELSHDRSVDRDALLDAWLARLAPRLLALDAGDFDAVGWSTRQRTTGRTVEVDLGTQRIDGLAVGVDTDSGALLVETATEGLAIQSGEVVRCRVVETPQRGP